MYVLHRLRAAARFPALFVLAGALHEHLLLQDPQHRGRLHAAARPSAVPGDILERGVQPDVGGAVDGRAFLQVMQVSARTSIASGLASESASVAASSAILASARAGQPRSPQWFGEFSEGESTYSADVQKIASGMHGGWEPNADNPYSGGGAQTAAWYHESESAGAKQSWQSHYPALTTGLAGKSVDIGKWSVDGNGHWIQDYQELPTDGSGNHKDAPASKFAGWFENSIRQYDGFGRPRMPLPGSTQELIEGRLYTSRTVNAPLTCQQPGCVGSANLQAFIAGEEARKCRLSLWLHPTDFDDSYSGERLTFIKVNGVTVNTDCFPMVSGCNQSTQTPMFPCLQDQLLDTIINETGSLEVSAGIPDVVDECPYEGNLLSAVAMVSCLVPPPRPVVELPKEQPVAPVMPPPPRVPTFIAKSRAFRCDFRGCAADAELDLNEGPIPFSQCLLSVRANATDFDSEDGNNEWVDYVRINGTEVVTNFTPHLNPCRSIWAGKPLSPAEIEFPLVVDHDVTSAVVGNASGWLVVEVKISDFVDECAHDGYLLTGRVDVNCTIDVAAILAGVPDKPDNATNESALENSTENSTESGATGG